MKALTKILLVALLAVGLTSVVMAATDDSALTVTVSSIDLLSVGDATGGITLDGTAGSNALTGTDNAAATLNYTHNQTTPNKKITAEVTTDPTGDDITLTVTVADGAGEQTICTDGTATVGGAVVYTAITAGALTDKTVTYHATATASGSPAADYVFAITYTSTDV